MHSARLLRLIAFFAALFGTACAGTSLSGESAVGILGEGVINDPANKSLRFDLLQFGLSEFCHELQERGTPIRLRADDPVQGRIQAVKCEQQIIDDEGRQSLVVRFEGSGYLWSNIAGLVSFELKALLELAPDFQLANESMYIYFRSRDINSLQFKPIYIQETAAKIASGLGLLNAQDAGRESVLQQLRNGFTVLRESKTGHTEFAMGLLAKGERRFHPFQLQGSQGRIIDNDRTEIATAQRDIIGPFRVEGDGQLALHGRLEGAEQLQSVILSEKVGKTLREEYLKGNIGELPSGSGHCQFHRGETQKCEFLLQTGSYYLVLIGEKSSSAALDYLLINR